MDSVSCPFPLAEQGPYQSSLKRDAGLDSISRLTTGYWKRCPRCRRGDMQCCALSTQTTQDSPGAEPRRSKRKLRQIFGIKLNRQLILFQTHRLVTGTQAGRRHPSFTTKHDKT